MFFFNINTTHVPKWYEFISGMLKCHAVTSDVLYFMSGYKSSATNTRTHTCTYSINHGVLWLYLLNANKMDKGDKPLPFSIHVCLENSERG